MKSRAKLFACFGIAFGALVIGKSMADAPKSQWEGAYSKAQSQRGEALYAEHCLVCHGADLLGGEMAPPLIGGQFHSNWTDLSLGDLFERIRTSMPLNAPGTLSRQQCADILSFMLSKDGAPAGQSELPPQTEALKEIKFLGSKP